MINPLTATLYHDDKTNRLNILHAWWPGGLILGGVLGLALGQCGLPWSVKYALVLLPAVIFGVLCCTLTFPASERAAAGVSTATMVGEVRRPLFLVLFLAMVLTAAAELAPGQWVDFALTRTTGMQGIWLLVYVAGGSTPIPLKQHHLPHPKEGEVIFAFEERMSFESLAQATKVKRSLSDMIDEQQANDLVSVALVPTDDIYEIVLRTSDLALGGLAGVIKGTAKPGFQLCHSVNGVFNHHDVTRPVNPVCSSNLTSLLKGFLDRSSCRPLPVGGPSKATAK